MIQQLESNLNHFPKEKTPHTQNTPYEDYGFEAYGDWKRIACHKPLDGSLIQKEHYTPEQLLLRERN